MQGPGYNEPIETGILRTLKYFGLFRYPLLPAEIHRFHPLKCSLQEVGDCLASLTEAGTVFCSGEGYYSIRGSGEWSAARVLGNQRALKLLSRSGRFVRIIRSFPFVDAVAISGSLSKLHAGDDADIDYFIITAENRLWIARTLLHIFKKLTFIAGCQHYFCMNYFVDAGALEMTDQNLYTAIELTTLIPVYNKQGINSLVAVNPWTAAFLPNMTNVPVSSYLVTHSRETMKHCFEWLINRCMPESLNRSLMRLTDRKWRRKWQRKGFPMEEYEQAFHTSLHVSKNHPANFQKRVLTALESNTPTDLT